MIYLRYVGDDWPDDVDGTYEVELVHTQVIGDELVMWLRYLGPREDDE